jgi:hypothetical protein
MATKVFLGSTDSFTAATNNLEVIGAAGGSEKLLVQSAVTGFKTDGNIERIELAGNIADYKFIVVAGTGLQIQNASSVVVGTVPTLNQNATFAFADGSTTVAQTGATTFTVGGVTASTGAAAAIVGATLNSADKSSVAGTGTGGTSATSGTVLTTNQDNLLGTANNDAFIARIFNNSNTLQSGDVIDGSGGTNNSLQADVGNSQNFAITPETTNIQTAAFRAQADPADSNQNNMPNGASTNSNATAVQIDAQRMAGVTRWEDNNSRSDLLIEDVRIASDKITKNITIAMVETDPGNVDFGVYFDPYSLRTSATATSSFQFKLRDGLPGIDPITNPLGNLNVDGVLFTLGGASIQLKTPAIDAAVTYVQLAAALNAAIAAQSNAAGLVAAVGSTFTEVNTVPATGNYITITDTQGRSFDVNSFTFTHSTAPTGAFVELGKFESGTTITSTDLVTSTVVLDDVGRGSTGGDLVIGSLSVGDTSTSRGVERFEITVLDNSKLQHISSTNNTLMEVTIANGATSTASNTYINTVNPVVLNAGNLTVLGNALGVATGSTADDIALPGTSITASGSRVAVATHAKDYGFTDVRLIDGSAMTGKLAFNAEITTASIAKYINRVDTATDPAADNIAFTYSGGTNADTISVNIDPTAVTSRSNLLVGREDFTFTINGNAGNDAITAAIESSDALVGKFENWYNNQDLNNNIFINGGAGNDVIRTPSAGDKTVDGGADNDWIFTDNTGSQTNTVATATGAVNTIDKGAWVLNTTDQTSTNGNAGALAARNLNDIRSDVNNTYNLHNTKLFVTFLGIQSATITLANTTTYKTTDLEINQAIKNAINTDPILKAILVAKDGPANSLIIESLVDGTMDINDFQVTLQAPTAAFTASEVTAISTAWGSTYADSAAVLVALNTNLGNFNTKGDYVDVMATDGAIEIIGADSINVTDTVITPGSGDDVIVLSTKVPGADVGRSSNEVITFAAGFGNDTIINFDVAGNGVDHLNFGAFLKNTTAATLGALGNTNSVVVITPEVTATNGTATLIKVLVEAAAQPAAGTTTNQVYIAYSTVASSFSDATNNIGKVYSITNGSGATDAVVTLEGTIDLSYTSWANVVQANLNVPVANASLPFGTGTLKNFIASEGPSTLVPLYQTAVAANQVLFGTAGLDILNNGGFNGVSMTGLGSGDVFTVTGATSTNITDLTTGDSLNVAIGASITTLAGGLASVSSFVASADTVNNSGAVGNVVLSSLAAGSTINMAAATGNTGFTLSGGAGADILTGSILGDVITGGNGANTLNGGAGNDDITGGTGLDLINGGTGNDIIRVAGTASVAGLAETYDGGDGIDTVVLGATTAFTGVTNFSNIEVVTAIVAGANTITFDAAAITGDSTTFIGAGGDDVLIVNGTAAADTIDLSKVSVDGNFTAANVQINGLAGNDTITGTPQPETITGGLGLDSLTGGLGADIFAFDGTAGVTNDPVIGDFDTIVDFVVGTDKLTFTSVVDVVSVQQAAVQVAVTALASGSTPAQIATAMALANTTNLGVSFATYGGNTYVLYETTGANVNFTVADDIFIKLTGITTIPTFAGDVV